MSRRWKKPTTWPPESGQSDLPDSVVLSDGVVTKLIPLPILREETKLVSKPPANTCFPLHPLGVVRLYELACDYIGDVEGLKLSTRDKAALQSEIWGASRKAFAPGSTVKTGFERLLDEVPAGSGLREIAGSGETNRDKRFALLALHAVAAAMTCWVGIEG